MARAKSARTPLRGLVHHSDRGSVYASGDYGDALTACGAVASMSRKGDCWDNAVAESFFATIKGEMIDHEDFQTRAEAIAAIADYIDGFYNVQPHALVDRLREPDRIRIEVDIETRSSIVKLSTEAGEAQPVPLEDGQDSVGPAPP